MPGPIEDEDLVLPDVLAWRRWLARHHADTDAVWLVVAKKGITTPTSLTITQSLEEALCVGWIDSQRRGRDATTFRQRYSPRRSRSPWSAINVTLAERLIAEGRMKPAGLAEVERARSDGRWAAAYAGQASMEVPDDLLAALAGSPDAARMFAILTSQNRFAILFRVNSAKRPDTRARRVAGFVQMLAEGRTVYPQRRTLAD